MGDELRQRTRADAREYRERILAGARRAHALHGPRVTVAEIAALAGVGVATLYRHFGSRRALLAEALGEDARLCSAVIEEGLGSADPWFGFSSTVHQLMALHARDRTGARARLADEHGATGPDERDASIRSMRRLLDRARDAGAVRRDVELTDVSLALMASEGIRGRSADARAVAARRLADLILTSMGDATGRPASG